MVLFLEDLTEKETNDLRVQPMFKGSRHCNISILIISQVYGKIWIRTIRTNGNIYHIIKAKNEKDNRNLYEVKASVDTTLNGVKWLIFSCWNKYERCQLLIRQKINIQDVIA